jgi:hypothetical protein
MKEIPLSQGKVAQVSDCRFENISQWKWYAMYNYGNWYAVRYCENNQLQTTILMHQEIMMFPGIDIDHWDGDGLNNQDENLRLCTPSQNGANRRVNKNNTSGYKGVYLHQETNKWEAHIKVNYKTIYIGVFLSAIDAAHAYDKIARRYFGEFAKTNFPGDER